MEAIRHTIAAWDADSVESVERETEAAKSALDDLMVAKLAEINNAAGAAIERANRRATERRHGASPSDQKR